MKPVVELRRPDIVGWIRILRARIMDEMPHHSILSKSVEPVGEVFPKEKFREGKLTKPNFGFHFPPRQFPHGVAKELKNQADIYAALIFRQGFESGDFLLEMLAQHFHQRDVEASLLVDAPEGKPFENRFALKFDRHEQDGSAENTVAVLSLLPFENTNRGIECVRAVFVQRDTGCAVKFGQATGVLG